MIGVGMKTVLFDLDGTLLDTLADLTAAVNFALGEVSLPLRTPEQVKAYVGNGIRNALTLAIGEGAEEKIEDALEYFHRYYRQHSLDYTCPYDGILPLLSRLQEEGFQIGIISNKGDENVKILAKRFFPQVSLALGEVPDRKRKPAPDSVWSAMKTLGASTEECVYIGDSDVDVFTAKNAGIPCIAVTWGFRSVAQLKEAGATVFAATVEELYQRICEVL